MKRYRAVKPWSLEEDSDDGEFVKFADAEAAINAADARVAELEELLRRAVIAMLCVPKGARNGEIISLPDRIEAVLAKGK